MKATMKEKQRYTPGERRREKRRKNERFAAVQCSPEGFI